MGALGTVVFVGALASSDQKVTRIAVKRIHIKREANDSICQEVELMKKAADHPHIIRYLCTEKTIDSM